MSTLADLLILKLASRFTKILVEISFGKGSLSNAAGDVIDVILGRIPGEAEKRKAKRDLESLGDQMARGLLPLFEIAGEGSDLNPEAVVLALDATLANRVTTEFLVSMDLEPSAILDELKRARPLPSGQYSEAETELYERALERSVRQLVGVAARLPQFQEAFAARSLHQLSAVVTGIEEVLSSVHHIEKSVGSKVGNRKAQQYEIEYRLAIRRNLDYLEVFGIDLPPESRIQKLSVAYVSLSLKNRSRGQLESLPAESLFNRLGTAHRRLLIRGDAGSGKSTLLRWAAIQAAAGSLKDLGSPRERPETSDPESAYWQDRVPFLIRLRQCRAGALPRPEELPQLVTQAAGVPPDNWAKSTLESGGSLLLLDGVDEIPNAHREAIRRGIADLVGHYPDNIYIVTTRPQAVEHNWLTRLGFIEARINPLSELDRGQFIDRWHGAVAEELREIGKANFNLRDLAASLKHELSSNPEVARLATNPLLCAMICALHRDRGQKLPERQRQLCEALCEALLHRRERESGLDLSEFPEPYRRLDYPQKRACVQELAHHMVLNGYSSVPTVEAREQIAKALRQFSGHSDDDVRVVTESLVERSGIIREETPGEISFVHNAFKELLAGDYFADSDAAGLLAKRSLDPDWQPVILSSVAADHRGFATKVIKKILEHRLDLLRDRRARQLMAVRCRAAALYLERDLDGRLEKLTSELFPPRSMEDAEALSSGGDGVVNYLKFSEGWKEREAAACVRALRLINTERARHILRGYLSDSRQAVLSELAAAVNPLEIGWVQAQIALGEALPEGIAHQIADLSPLGTFKNLKSLNLSEARAESILSISELRELEVLVLHNMPIEDLSPLSGLTKLRVLDLTGTKVKDIAPLRELHNLEYLFLAKTHTRDLSPLVGLSNLKTLDLMATEVEDLSPLSSLNNLDVLDVRDTKITDISCIAGLLGKVTLWEDLSYQINNDSEDDILLVDGQGDHF